MAHTMEKVDPAAPFIKEYKEYGITAEIAITEESDAVDVNLYTYVGDEFYDIMLATGPITEDNKKEADRLVEYYVDRYDFKRGFSHS